ncbi:MAG: hypothetical protein U0R50_02555 [Gaiellales bacterium]
MASTSTPTICDVSPRDGLQSLDVVLAPEVRAELVRRLAAAGVPRVETVSFVDPRRVPQMADPDRVLTSLPPLPGVVLSGLALNLTGCDRFLDTALDRLNYSVAASETFSQRNTGKAMHDAWDEATTAVGRSLAAGRPVTVTISVAFGCPYEHTPTLAAVREVAARLSAAGADEVVLADTVGSAAPSLVADVVARVVEVVERGARVGVHIHGAGAEATVATLAGVDAGALVIDAAVGGVGGCPFAPATVGNAATEAVVEALESRHLGTGIDAEALAATGAWLEAAVARAGSEQDPS